MRVLGVDGCKQGWIGVVLSGGTFERALVSKTIVMLAELAPDAATIAIDVPIGSEPQGFRQVDDAARDFIGPRRSSVFPVPPIVVLQAASYEEACAQCRQLTGKAPSKQTWELRKKILEVSEFAKDDNRVIEIHPEVSFRAIVGRPLEHRKGTWAGHQMRRSALRSVGIDVPDGIGEAGAVSVDDVLDAAVAAWSAHRYASGHAERLGTGEIADQGRPISIWY